MLKKPYKLFFRTLANEQRLEIINSLRKSPKNVTQICKELGFNQTTVSHNLRRLKACSFVFNKKNGKERIYSLNKETIKPLMELIDRHTDKFCKLKWQKEKIAVLMAYAHPVIAAYASAQKG